MIVAIVVTLVAWIAALTAWVVGLHRQLRRQETTMQWQERHTQKLEDWVTEQAVRLKNLEEWRKGGAPERMTASKSGRARGRRSERSTTGTN